MSVHILRKNVIHFLTVCSYLSLCIFCDNQEQVSGTTTNTVLKGLTPDTVYTVSVLPVYAEGDGKKNSENGKTSKAGWIAYYLINIPRD